MVNPNLARFRTLGDLGAAVAAASGQPRALATRIRCPRRALWAPAPRAAGSVDAPPSTATAFCTDMAAAARGSPLRKAMNARTIGRACSVRISDRTLSVAAYPASSRSAKSAASGAEETSRICHWFRSVPSGRIAPTRRTAVGRTGGELVTLVEHPVVERLRRRRCDNGYLVSVRESGQNLRQVLDGMFVQALDSVEKSVSIGRCDARPQAAQAE